MRKNTFFSQALRSGSLKKEYQIIWRFFYNNILAYLFLYIQNVLINRYMPTEYLGPFSYNQSLLILFTSVYSIEVYSVYLRYIGYCNEKELLKVSRKILSIASLLFLLTTLIYFKSAYYIVFFGYMWMRERLYFFRSKMDINTYGRIKMLQYFLSICFLIILILTGNINHETLLAGIGTSYLILSIVYNFNNKSKKAAISEDLPIVSEKEIIKYALPLSFNAIVVWVLGAADQMLIDKYLDVFTLTYYSVGFRIINVIRIGIGVIMEYWPRFYFERMEKRDYNAIKFMYMIFMVIVAILCIGMIIFSEQLYWLMGASQYSHMRWMYCILALSEMFRLWGAINMTFQSYIKNNTINVICLSVLGGAKLFVNWLNIENKGVLILLNTTLLCYLIYFLSSIYFGCFKERQYKYNRTRKHL